MRIELPRLNARCLTVRALRRRARPRVQVRSAQSIYQAGGIPQDAKETGHHQGILVLDILNLAYVAGILLSSITLYPQGEIPVSLEKDSFAQISLNREWWREDGNGKCTFKGVLVPFTRTWPEEVQRGGDAIVLPPEPDKIAGYVGVVNRKECVDQAPLAILRAGLARPRKEFFRPLQLDKHGFFPAGDMLETPADKIPPWLPQVIERMELLAQKDEAAKSFLAASANELDKVLPGRVSKTGPADAGAKTASAPLALPQATPEQSATTTSQPGGQSSSSTVPADSNRRSTSSNVSASMAEKPSP